MTGYYVVLPKMKHVDHVLSTSAKSMHLPKIRLHFPIVGQERNGVGYAMKLIYHLQVDIMTGEHILRVYIDTTFHGIYLSNIAKVVPINETM